MVFYLRFKHNIKETKMEFQGEKPTEYGLAAYIGERLVSHKITAF